MKLAPSPNSGALENVPSVVPGITSISRAQLAVWSARSDLKLLEMGLQSVLLANQELMLTKPVSLNFYP